MDGELLELAARCEAATGPSIQLDADIYRALRGHKHPGHPHYPYTASLDAAMTLVPEGLSFTLYAHSENAHCEVFRFHPSKGLLADVENVATPALALCAAALRARNPINE